MIKKIISQEWILTTIIVLLGTALCIRLGIWQLDRLEQRRAFNAHVEAMWAAEPLKLPEDAGLNLVEMEYRSACATGEYDFDAQVALRNQYWRDQYGYHLLTPLIMEDDTALLVDRGWIPAEDRAVNQNWREYDVEPRVKVCGIIRLGQDAPEIGGRRDPTLVPGQMSLIIWNNVNLERIDAQVDYSLLNVYLQVDMIEGFDDPPIPFQPEITLTEGPHLGYAGQWFMFAGLLLIGYPFFISRKEKQNE